MNRSQRGWVRVALAVVGTLVLAGVVRAEPMSVRIATHVSKLSPEYQQMQLFAKQVNKRLPGEFKFKFYPNGQLGKEKALITMTQAGAIEMIDVASGVIRLDPKLGLFDLPWLFANRQQVRCAMKKGLQKDVEKVIARKNFVVLGIYENGFRNVINTKRPIKEPSDLQGIKIRVGGGHFRQNVFQQMGATPESISWNETYTAMQTGVVDGAEAATYGFYGQKLYEVGKYISLTHHVYTPSFLLASKAFWGRLSAKQKKVFSEVGRQITNQAYRDAASLESKYLKAMGKNVQVNKVDIPAFQKATQASYSAYAKQEGHDWLNLVKSCGNGS